MMAEIAATSGQARAADPGAFVWVAANAGSGKTHVLVERLARILLAGTAPSRILCLTFTNAAAAEMANRLFSRLAGWSIKPDAELADDIRALTGEVPDAGLLARARRLFPQALESPGGLKIHTIHAFCDRLLHRFALESGVSPHFTVVDERGQRDLVAEARERVMSEAAAGGQAAPCAAALRTVAGLVHDMSLADLLAGLIDRRVAIANLEASDPAKLAAVMAWLAAELGVDANADEATVIETHFGDSMFDREKYQLAADVLSQGLPRDVAFATKIHTISIAGTPAKRLFAHRDAFLKKGGELIAVSRLITKALGEANPNQKLFLERELERAAVLKRELSGIATLAATRALLVLGDAMGQAYEALKRGRGLLDYDDLIARASNLLARAEDAQWVLYKLDGGIDHILVDEAQDTSPQQWAIVRYLAEDMLAGASARSPDARTTFAVGDEKQSIFSFQGADPAMFSQMRTFFAERAGAAGHAWDEVPLMTSFRSAPEVLRAVDLVFADPGLAAALSAEGLPPSHEAIRRGPGRVDIWSTEVPDEVDKPDPWTLPVDHVRADDPKLKLARVIADEISGWLGPEGDTQVLGRPVRPGDIMILVRRRNAFADAMVRELKGRGVPVAGVDRMVLTGQIVVQDLIALGRFVLLPDDDLSLAALLKSPLVGLGEDDLFDIAHGRDGSLWRALQAAARGDGRLEIARARLAGWLAMADQVAPFTFFARVLAADETRLAIARRLGPEAADPVEEFLNAALSFERDHVPTLEGFLAWLSQSEGAIKRDMDHGRDEVRVMTVHGAKGLEAPIVILPDTCQTPGAPRGINLVDVDFPFLTDTDPVQMPVWPRGGAGEEGILAEAVERGRLARDQEYLRLLYVAMTRARDWLIVTGYDTRRTRPQNCWYEVVKAGLADHLDETEGPDGRPRWRLRPDGADDGDAPAPEVASEPEAGSGMEVLAPPDWASEPVLLRAGARPLAPSRAADEPTDGLFSPLGERGTRRFGRGLAIHALLEHLPDVPPEDWLESGRRYLAEVAGDLDDAAREELLGEAIAVLELPAFAPFLDPAARSEVAFAATVELPGGASAFVEGRVDRLVVADGVVRVVDYKTHRPAPQEPADVPRAHLVQMALYRAALAEAFESDEVTTSLLWTDGPSLMALPGDQLDAALHDHVAGDGGGRA